MDAERRILLFGGTTEGREMAGELPALGFKVTVCVATKTGEEYLRGIPGLDIHTGRMDEDRMEDLMMEGFLLCIDATHPYALQASASIRKAAGRTGLPVFRLTRREMSLEELERSVSALVREYADAHPEEPCSASDPGRRFLRFCDSADQACGILLRAADLTGTRDGILLTTGAKEASCFAPLVREKRDRVFIRVLPSEESISRCLKAGFSEDHILTGRGPFCVEENVRIFRTYGIRTLVTKDGGPEGGFPEKLAAAALCRGCVIVIRRPKEEGMSSEEILRICQSKTVH